MKNLDYIITAKHYAEREGVTSVLARILRLRERLHKERNIRVNIADPSKVSGHAVLAEINFGQWIANCECGGAEFVDPDEPIFFCFGCGNRTNGGRIRPVKFPEPAEREEIERLVLERPVDDLRGLTDMERAHQAKPLVFDGGKPLTRCWKPNETSADLVEQNKILKAEKSHVV